ncbi:GntR family transcriptional regulator [Arthrobacter sp. MYb227]|uniref:GntR family transcriptional regulator n=1 Tax=Arthrobacter sp. MYb227 TaxID=1848601 RepID=UPI001C614065|nr:GntR family transcriptional regulator [Arthrobacter sp. MYb227]
MSTRVTALSIIDASADDIRRRIFEGILEQRSVQTEAEVSGRYEVARPTAKAAIERLVVEGLLGRGLHKSARVKVLGPGDVRDIYTARTIVESEVVRRLAITSSVPNRALEGNELIKARIGEPQRQSLTPIRISIRPW